MDRVYPVCADSDLADWSIVAAVLLRQDPDEEEDEEEDEDEDEDDQDEGDDSNDDGYSE